MFLPVGVIVEVLQTEDRHLADLAPDVESVALLPHQEHVPHLPSSSQMSGSLAQSEVTVPAARIITRRSLCHGRVCVSLSCFVYPETSYVVM